ncbi:ATP-dependent (S)-NAD(P)H-hydrate dehydratase-like [Leguminivora glycinivorella]|uniref:ATP-dependent (S)-NAD(P)H-hydrate dehydratase-like n=1 Tax=Leguminivora glycinivorella TaxID=1035111 RepID=UPI0020101C21|nr:ATP-dependent (S)-NAD(P)H-hydrate dehydratase-like [Leguminivora glycinivorella]
MNSIVKSLTAIGLHFVLCTKLVTSSIVEECSTIDNLNEERLLSLGKIIVPELEGKSKGDAGKICIIGGSTEYTGAPYFSAISSLKVGADLVFIITTENAAPVIKSYSPELIVYPYLSSKNLPNIVTLLNKMDIIIIGPGLGRDENTMKLTYDIIEACKMIKKPLIIDADGLYAVSNNLTIIKGYPLPGAILTPNNHEAKRFITAISSNSTWYTFWGDNVSVLHKGGEDHYYSSIASFDWTLSKGGSGRRAGGQGDILSGALGTFYTWALKYDLCDNDKSVQLAQSVAAFLSARFTRICNYKAFCIHGRSMTASDMINQIHASFDALFL